MDACQGLPAQLSSRCTVLVLGSMPGLASLQAAQYYAHPRNRFWPVMQHLFGVDPVLPYTERVCRLTACGIGLWDVLAHCRRPGSLDSAIVAGSEQAVPLLENLHKLPSLRAVVFNGSAAARLFDRHLARGFQELKPSVAMLSLPSTSPANAAWQLTRLQEAWSVLKPYASVR